MALWPGRIDVQLESGGCRVYQGETSPGERADDYQLREEGSSVADRGRHSSDHYDPAGHAQDQSQAEHAAARGRA